MLAWTLCAPQLLRSRSTAVPHFRTPKVKGRLSVLATQPSGGLLMTVPFALTAVVLDTWPAIVTAGGIGIRLPMETTVAPTWITADFSPTTSIPKPPLKTLPPCRIIVRHPHVVTSPVRRCRVANRLARPNSAALRRRLHDSLGKTRRCSSQR